MGLVPVKSQSSVNEGFFLVVNLARNLEETAPQVDVVVVVAESPLDVDVGCFVARESVDTFTYL